MVQTRKKEDSPGTSAKMPVKDVKSATRELRPRYEVSDKDDEDFVTKEESWGVRSRRSRPTRPQRNRRPNIRFEDAITRPSRTRRVVYVEQQESESEDDFHSDESIFQVSSRRRGGSRSLRTVRKCAGDRSMRSSSADHAASSNGHSEVSMEEDNGNNEDDGVRRSTRQRKLTYENLTASWIVGTQTLRGYPSYKQDEEPDKGMNTRQTRHHKQQSVQTSLTSQHSSPGRRSRSGPVKQESKRDDREEDGEDDEDEVEDEDEDRGAEEENAEESGVDRVKADRDGDRGDEPDNENESTGDEGENKRNGDVPRKRINRDLVLLGIDDVALHKTDDGFTDMYSRVKRVRRPTMRFTHSPSKSRSKPYRERDGSVVSQSSSDDGDSEYSDHEEESGKRCTRASGRTRKYQLRVVKPTVDRFQAQHEPARRPQRGYPKVLCNSVLRRFRRRSTNRYTQDSSSSSSDAEAHFEHKTSKNLAKAHSRCTPLKGAGAQFTGHHSILSKDGKAATLADVDPMALDTSIHFQHVGGLEEHIRCLQEMVVFPMLYKEVFEKFHISPPKGVLFHGPPGTGKTLLARALANECSQGDRKVSFFMRKGADCLSKWVGESERQLRLLFEQAFEMRPSIIFFDEIDGLAPVRSSKQDQIHASIVSTLLALMDGLDNRGEVLVIGATNRIDAIDPALRRPGRFDRELFFPLPAMKERQEILRIHMSKWDQKPEETILSDLAEQAGGYCGSDLRALCSESVIQALRRTYPQIYKCTQKLLIDPQKVQVGGADFAHARSSIVPAAHRVTPSPARKFPAFLEPLLNSSLIRVVSQIEDIFPHGLSRDVGIRAVVHRPRLILVGSCPEQAQTMLVAPALLHRMEHVPVHTLDLATMYEVSARSPEETVTQVFQEARRNPPSVIYLPSLGQWWNFIPNTVQAVFLMQLQKLDMRTPVLLLATSDCPYNSLPSEVCDLFSQYRDEVFAMSNPDERERRAFFEPLLLRMPFRPPDPPKSSDETLEELPLAPPPEPAKLTEEELKDLYEREEHTLRELRIFLREVCAKLARNRQFFMFTKPVDLEEVPDYHEIIEQPMDLETMMTRIDQHHYVCAREFLDDIDLICRNALEYNPDRNPADKLIRHRACFLRDTAYALIKAEMDSDFEQRCRNISRDRKKRKDSPSRYAPAPDFIHTQPLEEVSNCAKALTLNGNKSGSGRVVNGDLSSHSSMASNVAAVNTANGNNSTYSASRKRRRTAWNRGFIPKSTKRKRAVGPESPASSEKRASPDPSTCDADGENKTIDSSESKEGKDSNYSYMNGSYEQHNSDTELKSPKEEISHVHESTVVTSLDSCIEDASITPKRRTKSSESNRSSVGLLPSEVTVNRTELERFLTQIVLATASCAAGTIIELHVRIEKCIHRYQEQWDRSALPQELLQELQRFQAHRKK